MNINNSSVNSKAVGNCITICHTQSKNCKNTGDLSSFGWFLACPVFLKYLSTIPKEHSINEHLYQFEIQICNRKNTIPFRLIFQILLLFWRMDLLITALNCTTARFGPIHRSYKSDTCQTRAVKAKPVYINVPMHYHRTVVNFNVFHHFQRGFENQLYVLKKINYSEPSCQILTPILLIKWNTRSHPVFSRSLHHR